MSQPAANPCNAPIAPAQLLPGYYLIEESRFAIAGNPHGYSLRRMAELAKLELEIKKGKKLSIWKFSREA